jgi:hypothetical protein
LAITALAVIWLQIQPGAAEGDRFAKGQSGGATGPTRRFIAVMLAHIYIGTMGMEGAFEAMGSGTVDLNWVKEHHALWPEEGAHRQADPSQSQPTTVAGE